MGIYKALSERIRQLKAEGNVVIDRETVTNSVNLSDLPREELEEKCAKAMAYIALNQNGYRSFRKGLGVFLDYEAVKNKAVLQKLLDNAKEEKGKRGSIVYAIEKLINDLPEDELSDGRFDFDEETGDYIGIMVEMTKEELIEELRKLV